MNYTEQELIVLRAIGEGDDFNEMPTECFENLVDLTGFTKNQLKGVLGSLEKKDALMYGEFPNGLTAYHLPNEIAAFL